MQNIIALSGWRGSGKDTIADYLANNYGYKRIAFADKLKDMTAQQYDVPRNYFDNIDYKEKALEQYPIVPKDLFALNLSSLMLEEFRGLRGERVKNYEIDASGAFMGVIKGFRRPGRVQLYHTPRSLIILEGSVKRSVNPNYWVNKTIEDINNSKGNVVITDLRYKNEAKLLESTFSNKELKLIRIERFESPSSSDSSEVDLNEWKFKYNINNKSNLEDLYKEVDKLV